jgi:hypothetical protein
MTDHAYALTKAVYGRLAADAAIAALIGDPPRLYDGAPAGVASPFLVIGESRQRRVAGADGVFEHELRLSAYARHEGRRDALALVNAVHDALDDAPLALDGARLVSIRMTFFDVFERAETGAHYGVIRFRAVTQSPP